MNLRERLLFSIAGFGQNLMYNFVALFLLLYLVERGLPAHSVEAVTAVLTVVRVWDAANDIVVGLVVDRTRTRWGRFRPYIFVTALPIAALTTWMFSLQVEPLVPLLVLLAISYVLMDAVYTLSDVSYWALSAAATTDDRSRDRLMAWARVASLVALAVIIVGGIPLVRAFDGDVKGSGWTMAAAVICGAGMLLFMLAILVKERVPAPPASLPWRKSLRQLFSNQPLGIVLGSSILGFGREIVQVGGAVLAVVVFGDAETFTVLGGALIGGMALAAWLTPWMARFGTRRALMVWSNLATVALHFALWFLMPAASAQVKAEAGKAPVAILVADGSGTIVVAVLLFLIGMAYGMNMVLRTTMIGDTVDWGEVRHGVRADGASFAGLTFVAKLSGALALWAFGMILKLTGYQEGIAVTEEMRSTIWLAISLVPAVSIAISTIPLLWYRVPERELPELLRQKRAEA